MPTRTATRTATRTQHRLLVWASKAGAWFSDWISGVYRRPLHRRHRLGAWEESASSRARALRESAEREFPPR
ncbi:hypothetical protein [Noviherbaspirillum sp.]|uniref:hypothetical protein n=1 Tax=Noviherbaspirillum sp. TaxID=1926288 RepID=UPI002D2AC280|nr:hypothetical protein [Noviherbaspirillum sp.]HZW21035.1 hypothetical protein [Noviherbaspirillum sp.]